MTTTAGPDLLLTIVAAARQAAGVRSTQVPIARLEREIVAPRGGALFATAIADGPRPRIIAECKRRSPSRGILRADYDPAAHAAAYQAGGAAAISVLTEPTFFDGSLEHLRAVRSRVSLPILRKDFIVSRYQIVEAAAAGADAVLLIVGALSDRELGELMRDAASYGLAALVEAHDEVEVRRAIDGGAAIVGVNSRNLRTLAVDPDVHERVGRTLPRSVTAVAESGVRSAADVNRLEAAGYQAFLVGERLIAEPDPGLALCALRGGPR